MRPIAFSAATVEDALRRLRVATMPQLVEALGAPSKRTVHRKLRELDALTSYTHSGQYYALRESASFDGVGIWVHGEIRFSVHGTLRATLVALIEEAPRGWHSAELDELVGVRSAAALRDLVRTGRLSCVDVDGSTLYCAVDPDEQQRQVAARHTEKETFPKLLRKPNPLIAVATRNFMRVLDEDQQRMFAGMVSMMYGPAGDRIAAKCLRMSPKTIAECRRELESGPVGLDSEPQPGDEGTDQGDERVP